MPRFHTHLRTIRSLLDPYPRYPRDAGGHSRRMTRDGDAEGSLPGPAFSDVRKKIVPYFRTLFLLSHVRVCVYVMYSFFSVAQRKERETQDTLDGEKTVADDDEIAGIGQVKAESR